MSDSTATTAAAVSNGEITTPQVPQTPPAPEVQKPDDKFASKFAALTRKERDLREREGKSRAEVDAIKKQSEEYKTKYSPYETLENELKTDKRSALKFLYEKAGLTPEELSDLLLDELNPSAESKLAKTTSDVEKRLMAEIDSLKRSMSQKELDIIESQKKAEQDNFEKTVTQVKIDVKEFIDASDEFELIKLNGEYETVFEVMQEHYNDQVSKGVSPNSIKLLTFEEAAKFTESYLEEHANKMYEAKQAKKQAAPKEPGQLKTSPTLSNTLSTEVQSSGEIKPKSREESLARAARLLRYNEE